MSKLTNGVIANRLAFSGTFTKIEQNAMAVELLTLRAKNAKLKAKIKRLKFEVIWANL